MELNRFILLLVLLPVVAVLAASKIPKMQRHPNLRKFYLLKWFLQIQLDPQRSFFLRRTLIVLYQFIMPEKHGMKQRERASDE